MRWNRPDAGNVPPEIFIDVAEMTGQIDPLTRFSFHRALRQLSEWPKSLGAIGVAVNVAPSIISNPELVEVIKGAASLCSVSLERLTVEVTENAAAGGPRAKPPRADGAARTRGSHFDRRLRHRLFVARLPEADPGRRAEDRQVLRDQHARG